MKLVSTNRSPALRLERFLPYRLVVLASQVSEALSHIYGQRYGLAIPEWRVLATLGQFGTMTAKAIGAHSHMDKTKVSRAVARLARRRLLLRRTNRADQREAFLSLTAKGRALYEEVAPTALAFAERLFEGLAPGERVAFERVLDRLTERTGRLLRETRVPTPEQMKRREIREARR